MEILGLSGSLRRASSNTQLLEAARLLVPDGVTLVVEDGIGELPHFSPDLDQAPPEVAVRWRLRVERADAIVVSCPEYAGGIPGAFKNALDWLVGCTAMYEKPVAIVHASPSSVIVPGALRCVLGYLSASVREEACVTVSLRGRKLDANAISQTPDLADPLRTALAALSSSSGGRRA